LQSIASEEGKHMHKLVAPSFIDPRWFNQMRSGTHEALVIDSQSVNVDGQLLRLADPGEIQLDPSRKAFVILTSYFYLETEDERQERQRKATEMEAQRQEEIHRVLNRYRDEAATFNATLHIPVAWKVGIKDVLSGLLERSMGNGRNAATVEHIWLQEDLHEGRLQRKKGDFLCTSASGSNGKQWSAQTEKTHFDGDGKSYLPKVTCQACLKIAQRWNA
jgi:hypothetical protein